MNKRFIALTVGVVAVFGITTAVIAADKIKEFKTRGYTFENGGEQQAVITADEAKKAAFEKAGIDANEAEFVKVDFDRDDGFLYYDIEFNAGGFEYDIEVSAEDGKILSFDKEKEEMFD